MLPPNTDLQVEFLSWHDIDALIDHLLPQFRGEFGAVLMITRGGLVPGGCLAEVLRVEKIGRASCRERVSNFV
jgi:hypoxanthine phosphoribosyltransferase